MTTTSGRPPSRSADHLSYFTFDPDALRCPQVVLAPLRVESPVAFVEAAGMYIVTSHEHVSAIMRNPQDFSSHLSIGPNAHAIYDEMLRIARASGELQDRVQDYAAGPRHVLINADPPAHGRHRALISHAFTPARIREFEPEIRAIAERLIDGFGDGGPVEIVGQFTEKFTMHVVRLILGVPESRMADLREWSDAFGRGVGTGEVPQAEIAELASSRLSFDRYFTEQVAARLQEPADDLVSDIARGVDVDERPLSEDELLAVFQQLVLGGNATIGSLINDALLVMLRDEAWWRRLQAEPALLADFVEEVMRHAAPVQAMFRQATRTTEVGGVRIEEGSIVYLSLAAASRDPAVFPDPDDFTPGRGNVRRHLALGDGPHYCIGAHLGRAQARIAIECLLARFSSMRPRDDGAVEFVPSIVFHTPGELQVELVPRS